MIRRNSLLFMLMTLPVVLLSCQMNKASSDWDAADQIINQISVPVFPQRDFTVSDFGAVGDSVADCFPAFRDAINTCNQQGGGRVVVPAGIYRLKGPVHLKSNVNLFLEKGARLEFSSDPSDYLPVVLTRWEGTELFNYSPFIYAYQVTNVAVTGKGIIDGNAQKLFATWKQKQAKDKTLLRQMGNDGIPVNERVFGAGHFLRPSMIQTYGCKNVLIEGVTIVDSPLWVIHPTLSKDITIRNVTVDSWNTNNDGVDPDGCVNVLIENCTFNCGDDAVAIKSGRDQDGWRIGQPTENVVIRNCIMNSRANGLCIGSEMSGSVRNIFMENCEVGEALSAIYFKANLDRGGVVENVFVRNINVQKATTALIRFDSNYKGHRGNNYPPKFQKFHIENIVCQTADHYGLYFKGIKGNPISDIVLKDITISRAEVPVFSQYVRNVELSGVSINDSTISEIAYYQDSPVSGKKLTW